MNQQAGSNQGRLEIPERKKRIYSFLTGRFYTIVITLATLLALFMTDAAKIAMVAPGSDPLLHLVSLIILLLFFADLVLNCAAGERVRGGKTVNVYVLSLLFWLDFLAMMSMIPDIPWLRDFFLKIMGIPTAAFGVLTITKLGRAAKAGARAARMVRVIKLFTGRPAGDGSSLAERAQSLSDRSLQKCVVMIMVLMVALPVASSLDKPAEVIRLEMLESNPAAAEAFLKEHGNVVYLNLAGTVLVDKKVDGYRPEEYGTAKTSSSECRFVMRMHMRAEAIFDLFITILIVLMLAIGGWAFRRDAEKVLAEG